MEKEHNRKEQLSRVLRIRVSALQLQAMQENAQSRGMRLSAYMRETSLAGRPVQSRPRQKENQPLMEALLRIGNNINQVVRVAHTLGHIDAEPWEEALKELRQKIRSLN